MIGLQVGIHKQFPDCK